MESNKMSEVATRKKFRFPFKGSISVEDLWDLSLQQLDGIYKTLNSQQRQAQEASLLTVCTAEDEDLSLKIEIIKHIVSVKQDEINAAVRAKEVKDQREKIMAILADKQDQDLRSKTPEELQEMLNQLG